MNKLYMFICISFFLCLLPMFGQATPYWSPQDLQQANTRRLAHPRLDIDPLPADNTYALLFEYVQTCEFLASMQEPDSFSANFGGMHEGETPDLWAIIQTDNTQEAIRVWSTYARLSGDLETYRLNIARAWIYNLNYRAWREEGAPGEDYYRVHNCGWGLVAEAEYRQVYGDTTFLWYADSCAWYILHHRLPYSGTWYQLNPLVEGWAAGTLYDYGIEQRVPRAVSHSLTVGGDVQDWIEADPNRLNYNEEWAMSGGTAMWGVCRSVFTADTAAGQAWLPNYLPYMDTYAGLGQWNQSWNVWYAHAWHAAEAITHDTIYTQHAFALVDTLLDSDNPVDNDGGIMATSTDPVTMDQSWVSCYLDYMGMAPLIYQAAPLDAAALGFLQPDLNQPVVQGQPVPVSVIVGNTGLQPFGLTGAIVRGEYSGHGTTTLVFADIDTIFLGMWTPQHPGSFRLTMKIVPVIGPTANDTVSIIVPVLGWGRIQGQVLDLQSSAPLKASVNCFSLDYPSINPTYTTETDSSTGYYHLPVNEGSYRVVVDPQVPYTDRDEDSVLVTIGEDVVVNFSLLPAPVLLVDDDGGASYQQYYTIPLNQAGYDAYWWDISELGIPDEEMSLFDGVIWFTGNVLDSVLDLAEQTSLAVYLNAGGNLFITGQNIAQGLAGQSFLTNYLRASFISSPAAAFQVNGVTGDPVTSGLSLLFAGTGGAGNQNSKDIIQAISPGVESMRYAGTSQPTAAVRVDTVYKLLYLACGLEGATGLAGTTTRQQFLQAVLNWFEISPNQDLTGTRKVGSQVFTLPPPNEFSIISITPNPFNPEVQLRFTLPYSEAPELRIYDVLGRNVTTLTLGWLPQGEHRFTYRFPAHLASGAYFFVLKGKEAKTIGEGILMK